jgi:predicted transcriptional regulator
MQENITGKLKKYIEENGLKHGYVADKSGIDYRKFSRIINGRQRLSLDEFEMICEKGLSVKPSIFFD